MTKRLKDIRIIAIDADDTLWDCQSHFDKAEEQYCQLLSAFAGKEAISEQLFQTERNNMACLGFGCKAFTLSLIENATRIAGNQLTSDMVSEMIRMGKDLLNFPTTPLPEVEETLRQLHTLSKEKGFKTVVFTKGELQDQENKLARSGLKGYFDDVVIVADKTEETFQQLCRTFNIMPQQLLMVGNSFKSDITPALCIGAHALHIPYHVVWQLEVADEFEHPNANRIKRFSEILDFL